MSCVNKAEALAMLENGATYAEVGRAFGVSRQYIHWLLKNNPNVKKCRRTYPSIRKYPVRFPVLYDWVNKNCSTMKEFGDLIHRSHNVVYGWFKGTVDPTFDNVKTVLEVTGLPFEEAFKEAE